MAARKLDTTVTSTSDNDHIYGLGKRFYTSLEQLRAENPQVDIARAACPQPAPVSAEQAQAWQDYLASRKRDAADAKAADDAAKQARHTATEASRLAKAQLAEALEYVRTYTGTWALVLDIKADRRMGTKYMTLSPRQVEVLLAGKARDAARADALQLARELYADDQWLAAQAAPKAQAAAPAQPQQAKLTQDGIYRTPDGTVYKVQAAKVSGSGHLYAKRLVVEDGHGSFVYAPGAMRQLTPAMRMTLDEAAEYGKLYGVCVKCGSPLTDEASIARGIGPICARNGWD